MSENKKLAVIEVAIKRALAYVAISGFVIWGYLNRVMACTNGSSSGTITTDAQQNHGSGSPQLDKVQHPRPSWNVDFFMPVGCTRRAQLSFLVGRAGMRASVCRFLIPVFQPRAVCHPCLEARAAGFKPVDKVPFMANTPTSLPSTGKHTHPFDPVVLHNEAVNACHVARWHAAHHQHAAAAREVVQALSALHQFATAKHLAK